MVEIIDGTDNDVVQAVAEDQVKVVVVNWMAGKEVRVLGVEGEIFKEGEDMLDILCRVVARDQEIPRYLNPLRYDDLNYIPDRQV